MRILVWFRFVILLAGARRTMGYGVYVGCFVDGSPRALDTNGYYQHPDATVDTCAIACKGYTFFWNRKRQRVENSLLCSPRFLH